MSGWLIFLIIALVLGVILSNIMLLKHTAKMEIPASVIKAVKERREAEQLQKQEQEEQNKKKPNED